MKSDMRTKQEIRQAVAILRHKGDRISMLQGSYAGGRQKRGVGIRHLCDFCSRRSQG